jgi:pimeloyl-ACP methyl ester carboxylesterase
VLPLVQGARLLAWEMIGYGRSWDVPSHVDISVNAQAGHLHGWLDELGVDRAVLVGHDLGDGVCQIAAVSRPERCAGLVLTNSIAYDSWPIPMVRALQRIRGGTGRLPPALIKPLLAGFLEVADAIRGVVGGRT